MPGRDPKPGGGAAAFVASPQVILQQLLHARNEYRTQQQYSQRRDCEADHGDLERPGGCRATSVSSVVDSAPEGRAAPSETGAEQHSPEKRSEPVLANSVPLKTAEAPQSTEDSACIQGRQGDESFHDDHSPMPGGIAPSKEADWNSPSSHEVAKDESSFAPVVYSLASSSGAEPHSESGLLKIRSDRSGFGERVSGQQAVSQGGSFSPYTTAGEGSGDEDEELRTVVVVMRHGDRKPKQKLKFQTEQDLILELFEGRSPRKEVKLKSPEELKDLLERNTEIITSMGREMASLVAGIKTLSEHKAAAEAAAKASTSSDPKPTSESPGSGTASPCDHVPELGPGTPEGGPPRVVFSQPFGLMKDEASCMATPSPPDSTSNPDGSGHIVADVTAALERQEGLVAKLQKELAQHKQLQKVLLQGDGFAGINRKIQLKPTEWDDAGFSSDSSATTKCEVPCPRDGLSEGQTVSS
ncbi:histidine acid phosphatase superfamily protein, partial [Cystoisospora suis]